MADLQNGYDARCLNCLYPFTFANAKGVRTVNWRHFCSPGCQRREPVFQPRKNTRGAAHRDEGERPHG